MTAHRAEIEYQGLPLEAGESLGGSTGSGSILPCALLASVTALSRYLCRSHVLYDIDSVNFALAMDHFDPAVHQPHPPGYFLYVCTARAVNALFHDANASLVAISILASCAAVVLLYLLARNWFGPRAALFTGAMFVCSPLCFFHGTVALTYIVEAFFSVLIGYLCWRGYTGETSLLVIAAVVLGISAGFRPSSMLFLSPLWLFSLYGARTRVKAAALTILGLTILSWWIPMIQASGGLRAYAGALFVLWSHVPAKQMIGVASTLVALARILTIFGIAILCFGCASVLVFRRDRQSDPLRRKRKLFTWIWMAPGLVFFSLVFLLFVNSGYLLVISPPAFIWLGLRAADWYAQDSRNRSRRGVLTLAAAVLNVGIFLFAPLYCSFREVRHFEAMLTRTTAALRRSFKPEDTLIVGFDSHFMGYRHAAYYLPEFLTVEAPPVVRPEGKRIFAVQARRTSLVATIPALKFQQFVFFPLPEAKDYKAHMEKQDAGFPSGVLKSQGTDPVLITGATTSLKYLFPPEMLVGAEQPR